jgi:hypothetical protein
MLAAAIWLGIASLFSCYVAYFGSYNQIYGELGAIVCFMTWMCLSLVVVLLGAKLDASSSHTLLPAAVPAISSASSYDGKVERLLLRICCLHVASRGSYRRPIGEALPPNSLQHIRASAQSVVRHAGYLHRRGDLGQADPRRQIPYWATR